jgi:hypothetical protein
MSEKLKQCEYILLRYVPDAVREEFVNIGVILLEGEAAHLGFTHDWRRVRCLDPAADVETLANMETDLSAQLARGVLDRATLLGKLQDYCSNGLQFTAPKGCLAQDAAQELETLARLYLQPRAGHGPAARDSARQQIVAQMKDAFTQAGVWARMRKKIAAAPYTHKGDPLKIDCGYRPNGVIRLFHAVALAGETDTAKVLAFSYPDLRDGLLRAENVRSELTAIVEPDLNRADDAIAFAVAVLQRSEIAVATTAELTRIADAARVELKL